MDIRIDKIQCFAEGHAFGKAGTYERLTGIARGVLDPNSPQNTCIVDLEKAPRNAQGLVEYEIDVDILRPADPARANGVILHEVTNRGNKLIGRLNGVLPANPLNPIELNDPVTRAHAGNGFLFERGLTLVWSGWDPTLASRNAIMTVRFPLALEDGQPMVRRVREEFQVGKRVPSSDTIVLTYPAASLDKGKARLMMRRREADRRIEIPRDQWDFVDARHVRLLPEGTLPTPLTIYEFWYEATNSRVAGIAFCSGARSHLVPALFTRLAACGQQAAPRHRVRYLAKRPLPAALPRPAHESWPGRSAGVRRGARAHRRRRQDVHQSFVCRAETARRPSMWIICIRRRGFPFAAATATDPFSAATGSLLRGDGSDPLLIQSNTSAEYWEKGASLLTIDGLGKTDLVLPETSRAYLIAGTQHAGALPTAPRGPNANAVNWQSPMPAVRALLTAMEDWVVSGIAPPASCVPSIKDGTAVNAAAIRFPKAPDFATPHTRGARTTPVDWVDPAGKPGQRNRQGPRHLRHACVRGRCRRQ